MEDQLISDNFYHTVDLFIQLLGAEQVSKTDVFFRISRAAIGSYVDYSEINRILAEINSFYTWYDAWKKSADRFAYLAEQAELADHKITAGYHYLRAGLLYHFAQLFTRPEDPRRAEGQLKRVEYYRKACPLLNPPIEQVWIRYGQLSLPGYFRKPGETGAYPIVIMIPGANSVKEELHHWGEEFIKRGIATIALDGPGQGECAWKKGGVPMVFETYGEAIKATIDYLDTRADVKSDQIVIWGQSTGGHLAMRVAAHESRVLAAVSLGGGYDFRLEITPTAPADVWEEGRDLYGLTSFEEVVPFIRHHGSLKGIIDKVQCPLLVVHGARDNIVAMNEIDTIRKEASGPVTVMIFEDGNHSVCNRNLEMSSAVADWVQDRVSLKPILPLAD